MKIFTTDDFAVFMDDNSLTKEIPNKLLKVYNLLVKNFLNINGRAFSQIWHNIKYNYEKN